MRRVVLDSALLMAHWNRCRKGPLDHYREKDVVGWARKLIEIERSDAIVTPVGLELICGTLSKWALKLTRAYLGEFTVIDQGTVLDEDWQEALRLAARVPQSGKPRDLGDCLIRAIANRLNYDVTTPDKDFPSS